MIFGLHSGQLYFFEGEVRIYGYQFIYTEEP